MSQEFLITPNQSLTQGQGATFLLSFSILMALIAGIMIFHGFWPIIGFLGLDLIVLIWAFRVVRKKTALLERIQINQDTLSIQHRDRNQSMDWSFPTAWVKIRLEPPRNKHGTSKLQIGYHQQWVELAHGLLEEERQALHQRLQKVLFEVKNCRPTVTAPCTTGNV